MATPSQRAARRRQRARRAQRVRSVAHAAVMPQINPNRSRVRRRGRANRGLLANLGNMLLPGIGGVIGQFGDNALKPVLNNVFGGGKGSFAPVAGAGRLSSLQVNTSRERGVEQIAVLSVPSSATAGTILLQTLIAAPTIGVRLSNFSKLWTKTRFHRFDVEVISSNPSSVGGNYTVAIDPDPAQVYNSGIDLPARLMALTMAERANAWANVGLSMKPNPIPLFNRFHIEGASDAEIREYACGQLIVATTTDFDTDCEYIVNVHWDVEFEKPDTTEFISGDGPSTLWLNTTGADCTSTGTTTLTFSPTTSIFSRVPAGDFTLPLTGELVLEVNQVSGSPLQRIVVSLAYTLSTDTLVMTLNGVTPTGSRFIIGQNPSPFAINSTRSGMLTYGFGLFHPYIRNRNNEHAWKEASLKRVMSKRIRQAIERAEVESAYQQALGAFNDLHVV